MKHFLHFVFIAFLSTSASAQILADSSFEASGPANSPWSSTSSNFGTSFCDATSCGTCGGPCVPHSGTWYVWFGGTSSAEVGTAAQTFNTTTSGTGTLYFYLKVPMKGNPGDTLSILLDGVTQSKISAGDSIGAYVNISVNVGTLAVGSHNLTFRFEKLAGASAVNVLIDDVKLLLSGTVGVEEIDFSNGVQISGNPESGNIQVAYNFNKLQNIRLTATDMTGKTVYSNQFENQLSGEQTISSTGWAKGIYNMTIASDKGLVKTQKVVVY